MQLFHSLDPNVIKESSSFQNQISKLKEIRSKASAPVQEVIDQDISLLEMGLYGENRIMFELKNSHIPMYILHDLYFEKNGLSAQIDYLVICPRCSYVIECKNLFGNIEINSKGDFIRTVQFGKRYKKEGIYSPITQNTRHLELMRSLVLDSTFKNITNALSGDTFSSVFVPLVVLANDKTVLNDRYAKKEIKEKVLRLDHLIEYIKENESNGNIITNRTTGEMKKSAEMWLSFNTDNPTDYIEKYRTMEREFRATQAMTVTKDAPPECPNCHVPMVKRVAKTGARAGKEFWGCPNFPKCKNIVSID